MDLNKERQISKLAKELGCEADEKPVEAIMAYCRQRVRSMLRDFPVSSLSALLNVVAANVDTKFVEVQSNQDLRETKHYYFTGGEAGFARLEQELGPSALAITFRRLRAEKGEPAFISVIDYRGDKFFRAYFSKWHELAHLLTLTDPNRLKLCRTHMAVDYRDPEEVLMERIAAELAFFPDIVQDHAEGPISFDKIEALRDQLCKQASWEAAVINFTRQWPTPCVLIEVGQSSSSIEREEPEHGPAYKARQPRSVDLRVLRFTPSVKPHLLERVLFVNMPVPKSSIIYQVFSDESLKENTAVENLKDWAQNDVRILPSSPVRVHVRKDKHHLRALLVPIEPHSKTLGLRLLSTHEG